MHHLAQCPKAREQKSNSESNSDNTPKREKGQKKFKAIFLQIGVTACNYESLKLAAFVRKCSKKRSQVIKIGHPLLPLVTTRQQESSRVTTCPKNPIVSRDSTRSQVLGGFRFWASDFLTPPPVTPGGSSAAIEASE